MTTIDALPDEILLEIFDSYRMGISQLRWCHSTPWSWYALGQVCRRWREVLLTSSGRLKLQIYCNRGLPITVDMLTHSPPLPLTIEYYWADDATPRSRAAVYNSDGRLDKWTSTKMRGALFALKYLDRAVNIQLLTERSPPMLQFCSGMTGVAAPVLEALYLSSTCGARLPDAFLSGGAPRLRSLTMFNVNFHLFPAPGLVELTLVTRNEAESATFLLDKSAEYLQSMPVLQRLVIEFSGNEPFRTSQGHQLHPTTAPIVLPALTWLRFTGSNSSLEAILGRIQAPQLVFFALSHFESAMPTSLVRFVSSWEKLKPTEASITLGYGWALCASALRYPSLKDRSPSIHSHTYDDSSLLSLCNALAPAFLTVNRLSLLKDNSQQAQGEPPDVPGWRALLSIFKGITELCIEDDVALSAAEALRRLDISEVIPKLCVLDVRLHSPFHVHEDHVRALLDHFASARASVGVSLEVRCLLI
ncbi:hypothetical protein BC834DRAFT_165622 [Gloeopeniophorella convolvens]|nr:hypothetical protein BC834DRAFT_165622 [Gloeopeniophorella convolvens]